MPWICKWSRERLIQILTNSLSYIWSVKSELGTVYKLSMHLCLHYTSMESFTGKTKKKLLKKATMAARFDLYLSNGFSVSDFSLQAHKGYGYSECTGPSRYPRQWGKYSAETIAPLLECVLSVFAAYEKVAFNTCCPFLSRAEDLLQADNDFSTLTAYSFSDIQDRKSHFQQFQKQWSETTAVRNDSITQTC